MNWVRAGAICSLGPLLLAPSLAAQDSWNGVDTSSYRLLIDEDGYRLARPGAAPLHVPTEWLEPPEARAQDEQTTTSSLAYVPEVTAFAIGGGRLGLHLASYDIQESGSMQAASGRDVFLILAPETGELLHAPPHLGVSRGRVRVGGCFSATFHHISLGDVDCDRYLDLGVVAEQVSCGLPPDADSGPQEALYTKGPVRWHLQNRSGWSEDAAYENRLPCAGWVELPLLGLSSTPVDFVLGFRRRQAPLPSGEPEPLPELPRR